MKPIELSFDDTIIGLTPDELRRWKSGVASHVTQAHCDHVNVALLQYKITNHLTVGQYAAEISRIRFDSLFITLPSILKGTDACFRGRIQIARQRRWESVTSALPLKSNPSGLEHDRWTLSSVKRRFFGFGSGRDHFWQLQSRMVVSAQFFAFFRTQDLIRT
jgi:hypothetical protein